MKCEVKIPGGGICGNTKTIEAESCQVCKQGHLWFYGKVYPRSDKRGVVAIFNRGEWLSFERKGEPIKKERYQDDFFDAEYKYTIRDQKYFDRCQTALEEARERLKDKRRTFKKLWDSCDPCILGL